MKNSLLLLFFIVFSLSARKIIVDNQSSKDITVTASPVYLGTAAVDDATWVRDWDKWDNFAIASVDPHQRASIDLTNSSVPVGGQYDFTDATQTRSITFIWGGQRNKCYAVDTTFNICGRNSTYFIITDPADSNNRIIVMK